MVHTDFDNFGIDMSRYGERDLTQEIGAAINFLGFYGLIAPSARWQCDNLTIFTGNHSLNEKLEVLASEEIAWARAPDLIATSGR